MQWGSHSWAHQGLPSHRVWNISGRWQLSTCNSHTPHFSATANWGHWLWPLSSVLCRGHLQPICCFLISLWHGPSQSKKLVPSSLATEHEEDSGCKNTTTVWHTELWHNFLARTGLGLNLDRQQKFYFRVSQVWHNGKKAICMHFLFFKSLSIITSFTFYSPSNISCFILYAAGQGDIHILFWCWACIQKEQVLKVDMQLIYLWLYYNINVHSLWKNNSIRLVCLFCIARKSSSSGRWRRDPMFCECISINVLPILCLILKLAEIENLWPVPTISFSPFQTLYFEVSVGACWAPALPATQVQRWDYGSSSFMSHIVMHSCTSLCGPWVWKA